MASNRQEAHFLLRRRRRRANRANGLLATGMRVQNTYNTGKRRQRVLGKRANLNTYKVFGSDSLAPPRNCGKYMLGRVNTYRPSASLMNRPR